MPTPGPSNPTGVSHGRIAMLVKNTFQFDARVEREARTLAEDGWRVRVVALHDGGCLPEHEQRDGIDVVRVHRIYGRLARYGPASTVAPNTSNGPAPTSSDSECVRRGLQRAGSLARSPLLAPLRLTNAAVVNQRMALAGISWQPHVVYAHDLNTLGVAARVADRLGAHLVYDSHELHTQRAGHGFLRRKAAAVQERRLIHTVDRVLTSSDSYANYLTFRYNIYKPTVVRNVPDDGPVTDPVDLHSELGLPWSTRVMLYHGSIQPNRGIEFAVDALNALEGWILVLIGYGAHVPRLRRLVEERRLSERVYFLGPVPHRQLLRWAASATVGLCLVQDRGLSYRWSLPNKIFEYAAAGIPVVTSDFGEMAYWVEANGWGESCDPTDPRAIATAVARASSHNSRTMTPASWTAEARRLTKAMSKFNPRGTAGVEGAKPSVLLVASNGVGSGHLTRIAAVARALATRGLLPIVASMSEAVDTLEHDGTSYEIIPSRTRMDVSKRGWNAYLRERVILLIDAHQCSGIVFDGTWPYEGFVEALMARRDRFAFWLRRGMWRTAMGSPALKLARFFDEVWEPGEFAAERDAGATAGDTGVWRMPPIVHTGPDEMLDRTNARLELGISLDSRCVLVTLGAGVIDDVQLPLKTVISALAEMGDVNIFVTNSDVPVPEIGKVQSLNVRPLGRVLAAFDFAVSAAGYNSVHEFLSGCVPTLFLPNRTTAVDDQEARAVWASELGVGLTATTDDPEGIYRQLRRLRDESERGRLVANCRKLPDVDGAARVADRIAVSVTGS